MNASSSPNVNQSTSHIDVLEWGMTILKQAELNATVVVETPWSNVIKMTTPQGAVYLKQTPPALFLEVEIIKNCRELCGVLDIPEVIAVNKELNCFLMKESGDLSLRTLFDGQINVELLIQGLQLYKKMQMATAPHIDTFLRAGAPDWRLDNFPTLYQGLISNEEFLKDHGLESTQIQILQNSLEKLKHLCQELSMYGIAECLNHSDFHDNNMLFSRTTQRISIIDLGETAINHPFFSLAAFLKIPYDRYNLKLTSTDFQRLQQACFNGWLEDQKDISRALAIINTLLPLYLLFAQKRFLDAINLPYNADIPMSLKQHDKINKGLIWLIANMSAEY